MLYGFVCIIRFLRVCGFGFMLMKFYVERVRIFNFSKNCKKNIFVEFNLLGLGRVRYGYFKKFIRRVRYIVWIKNYRVRGIKMERD